MLMVLGMLLILFVVAFLFKTKGGTKWNRVRETTLTMVTESPRGI